MAVAVPIFDAQRRVRAALSVAGPAFRMDDTAIERHFEALRAGVNNIEEQLL